MTQIIKKLSALFWKTPAFEPKSLEHFLVPLKPPRLMLYVVLFVHFIAAIFVLILVHFWRLQGIAVLVLSYNVYRLVAWYMQCSRLAYFGYDGQFYLVKKTQPETRRENAKHYVVVKGEFLASYFLILLRLEKLDLLTQQSSKPTQLILHAGLLSTEDMSRINRALR